MKLNINNFRDISGYTNTEGKTMKPNMIFRGASLDKITDEQAKYMEDTLNIRHILDYRDQQEANSKKDYPFEKAEYERISALITSNNEAQGFDFGELLKKEMTPSHLTYMTNYLLDGYSHMPFNNPAYHRLFDLLLENDGCVYFHCSAGKDRTGIAGFLIMIALKMTEEDAIQEYLKSNASLKDFVEGFYASMNVPDEYRKYGDELLYVNEKNIQCTIKAIKEKYSSYDEFLEKEYGLDENKRN
ncbi:tyrosine-protein phosphatase [Floccifex sp.]|uniref:tyrosine-protein phosphatase n=1 Tax=Floccifex sp. TaxID=2815810 RepID=UPI002A763876|nr:tyrosine-protein phosphatase [Floccifex sp.]MDY2959024.1 tyrosine-protein phosphatase [Floccifex sp.]